MLTQPGYDISCFTSILAFAFALYNALRPDPCAKIIDTSQAEAEYDFVICGGGSAGAVVANRLSEIGNWTVLLLEAGGHENDFSDVPYLYAQLEDTRFDWKYKTERPTDGQRYCLSMTNHSCKWPRGKVLGGTSVINGMLYVRGNKKDFDNWEAAGNTGWGYKHVLDYFLKSENNSNPSYLQTPFHSCGGYLSVEDYRYITPLADTFIKGGKCLGYYHLDINGKNQTGFTIPQGTLRDGRRCSTSKAFIRTAQHRPNLNISLHSFVTKIEFEDEQGTPRARLVHYVRGKKEYSVRAKKEVVLCAGAVNSPQILMLSGIGPKEHLKSLGIKPMKNLRVGYNLQDQISTGNIVFEVDKPVVINSSEVMTPDAILEYLQDGQGPLTSLVGSEGAAFMNSKYADPSGSYPDIQLIFQASSIYSSTNLSTVSDQLNFRPHLFDGTDYEHLADKYLFQIFPNVLRPKSRGRVMLQSTDPYEHPIIIPNYFAEKEDIAVLIDGIRLAFKLIETQPFKALNATPIKIPFPGCENHELFSDDYLNCMVRHFTGMTYHVSCTCPMGVGPEAVVDPRLRVHGVNGLRVIDASIMPNVTSGNTNTPTIMIAEKGSDMIKEDWNVHVVPPSKYVKRSNCSRIKECQL